MSKRLFLLDAYALIFRAYYAFIKNPRINSKGMDTSAIMGFMNSLLDLIKRENPDYIAVCFDKGGSKDRTEIFPEYKSNRHETPEPIIIAVPYIKEILTVMNIQIIEKEGFEADDIIGTIAKQAEKDGYTTYMVTSDKDFAQLVSKNVFMYRPARMGNGIEIWGIDEVKEKFEITDPIQVTDYLGMMGDSVDNIPGLPGVGDKTAKKFLKEFGEMENLFKNLDKVKGKLKDKIESNMDLGLLSKKLATIITDVPVKFEEKKFKFIEPNTNDLFKILDELEFRRIKENIHKIFEIDSKSNLSENNKENLKNDSKKSNSQLDLFSSPAYSENQKVSQNKNTIQSSKHFYQYINSNKGKEILLNKLMLQKSVCFDTETTNIDSLKAELVGIAFSWEAHKGYYLPIPKEKEKAREVINFFRPFFENEQIEKVGHNLKYDLKVLSNYDVKVFGPIFDTMIAHHLINPEMRNKMDILSETYLNYIPIPITDLIGENKKNQISMGEVDLDKQTAYAVEDTDVTLQLKKIFEKNIIEKNANELLTKVELPLLRILSEMEMEGICLDKEFLKKLSKSLSKEIIALETLIYKKVGETFNLASPKQLGAVLFDKLKLVKNPKKTKTGQYSTSEEILSTLSKDNQIVSDILEWRSLQKIQNTYVTALPLEVNESTGRIHTIFNQTVTSTGRLSSNRPNLQNIPIKTEKGKEVRKAFVSKDKNHVLISADYSQIELRVIAALSSDFNMINAFNDKKDIHSSTAAKIFNIPIDKVTREQRTNAKTVNFGIIYGVSAFGLSQQTTLNRTESKDLIESYYKTYPKLRDFISNQISFARENGYVETILGRRRYLNNINSQNSIIRSADERNAVNSPIQGSAADIIKLAMIGIQTKINDAKLRSKMLLQVHDELIFEVPKNEIPQMKEIIKFEMENAFPLSVPLSVEIGEGENWLNAH